MDLRLDVCVARLNWSQNIAEVGIFFSRALFVFRSWKDHEGGQCTHVTSSLALVRLELRRTCSLRRSKSCRIIDSCMKLVFH